MPCCQILGTKVGNVYPDHISNAHNEAAKPLKFNEIWERSFGLCLRDNTYVFLT